MSNQPTQKRKTDESERAKSHIRPIIVIMLSLFAVILVIVAIMVVRHFMTPVDHPLLSDSVSESTPGGETDDQVDFEDNDNEQGIDGLLPQA